MNQSEIHALRERLAARSLGGEDHPLVIWLAGFLWAVLFVVMAFI